MDKAISITSKYNQISESQLIVISQVKDFGIDEIYFSTDENQNSYPAVFIKKVQKFDDLALREVAITQKKIWNFKKVIFLYVYSETEIRIYNCAEKPLLIKSEDFDYKNELKTLEIESYKFSDKDKLKQLQKLFSTIAIDTGIIWTIKEAFEIRKKISLKQRVDKYLVQSLTHTAKQLQVEGLEINLIHKIIMRSLFLLYLEDRGATDANFYSKIKNGAQSYFDILEDVDKTYSLFRKLEEYFNGNVFTLDSNESISKEHLQIIKKCFINGNYDSQQQNLFEDLRLFDFSIIQIELLSEIYENFLAEINPTLKQDTGTYYTPPSLVELILNEKLPISQSEKNFKVKILDPTCGSGIFLVESFKRLVKRHENANTKKLTDFNELKKLLTENIFGIEIHPQSIKVAAFSLYLALVDNLNPKTIWQNKDYRLPYLINDPADDNLVEQGNNLFRSDTIEHNPEIEQIDFDLVVGNPPFGTKNLSQSIRNYSDKHGFAKEMVLPFLHKATTLSKKGEIALIFNTKVLTNTNGKYQAFRKWLFNECYVDKIYNFSILRKVPENFGGQLFGSATGPISVIFYTKNIPKDKSDTIIYYAPKTYIKSNVIEGVTIDSMDLKYLPREECQNPSTKIWKIAMWGGMSDFEIIKRISSKTVSMAKYFENSKNGWDFPRSGLNGDSEHQDFVPEQIMNSRYVQRFYTPKEALQKNSKYFRNIDSNLFKPPYVLFKKGQKNRKITASYIDYFAFCTTACYVFNGNVESSEKKALTSIFNSKITTYILFMISSSWGIEREQIFMDEVMETPAIMKLLNQNHISKIAGYFDEIMTDINSDFFIKDYSELEEKIDKVILQDVLGMTDREMVIINDSLEYSLDLFENKQKSEALLPVISVADYSKRLSSEINEFLNNQDIACNATIFKMPHFSPLMMIKLSFGNKTTDLVESKENVVQELRQLNKHLWTKQNTNIYFRKKLNYKSGNEIFIVRPNQRRFWTQSMAIEDASELILEILNEV
ncbi:HsdM family class I SAM-dependent methyltransferase [Bizionia paragorgiae]|uniref:HsdM family class I SAM-dependent methyltransferase n=1 Tax=Bizionia paragorgiae TaxID=283786 RepID=UPI003A95309C